MIPRVEEDDDDKRGACFAMRYHLGLPMRRPHAQSWQQLAITLPPTFFGISFGLGGLAGVWRLAATRFSLSMHIGDILYLLAALIFLFLLTAWITKLLADPHLFAQAVHDPWQGPFLALIPLSGIVLAFGLQPYALGPARLLFLLFWIALLLLNGWMIGQWVTDPIALSTFHPGYFLPVTAGGLVSADVAAHVNLSGLAWANFGMGIIGWFLYGSLIMGRLFFQPALPTAFLPTMAIWVAPPVLAGNAYFTLTHGGLTIPAFLFAGYTVLMILVQVRLIPRYRRMSFGPGFWSFAFSYAAVATYVLRWLALGLGKWVVPLSYLIVLAITLAIGIISVRTFFALKQGTVFLPPSDTLMNNE